MIKRVIKAGLYIVLETLFPLYRVFLSRPHILSLDETLDFITKEKGSIARFGDGEISWIEGINTNSFQSVNSDLASRLSDVLEEDLPNLLICIPGVFDRLHLFDLPTRQFWRIHMARNRKRWMRYLSRNRAYGDSLLTRPYIIYKDKDAASHRFKQLKTIWEGKGLLIVEGEKTFFGVGNDLLANASSVKRVLCPATDAFTYYDSILAEAKHHGVDRLILLAVGPTATILASDLAKDGLQAIDIGHLDIEYEWYLRKLKKKEQVPGKYVNESTERFAAYEELLVKDPHYQTAIVARIGC